MTRLSPALDAPLIGERRRLDVEAGALIGGVCHNCAARTWPRRAVCYRCGAGNLADVTLPTSGRLVTWTRVWVPVEDIEPPYLVGVVELGRVQVFAHVRGITDEDVAPADVRLVIDADHRPSFWFEVRRA